MIANPFLYKIYLLLFLFTTTSLLSYEERYEQFCQKASEDDTIFAHFKRAPHYNDILESLCERFGHDYLKFIVSHYPHLIPYFAIFKTNDAIGDPYLHRFGNFGLFSSTTLRYIKVAGDLLFRFGDLSQLHIVEIGGGYGGQCKILADCTNFASYTIIDLPSALALSQKYLSLFNIKNIKFVDKDDLSKLDKTYDLLISNYAFTEFLKEDAKKYETLIQSSRRGYLTGNFSPNPGFTTREEFLALMDQGDINPLFEEEQPSTGENNLIITWIKTLVKRDCVNNDSGIDGHPLHKNR